VICTRKNIPNVKGKSETEFGKVENWIKLNWLELNCKNTPSYTDEKWKTFQTIPKQYVFGLLIIVMIVL